MGLASRGLRDLDTGVEKVTDEAERAALMAQGRTVNLQSLAIAAVLTAIALAIP